MCVCAYGERAQATFIAYRGFSLFPVYGIATRSGSDITGNWGKKGNKTTPVYAANKQRFFKKT